MIAICFMVTLMFFGLVFRRSKVISCLILLYMWVFYAFNIYSGDSASYEYVYSLIGEGKLYNHFEPGFSAIMIFCSKMRLSYLDFKIILATLFVVLLKLAVDKFTNNTAFVLALFMFFPFAYFSSVLRAGIAGLIVALAIYELGSRKKYNSIRYILFIMIAVLFHTSSLFFLIFLLAKKRTSINTFAKVFGIVIMVSLSFKSGLLYNAAAMLTNNEKILQWMSLNGDNGFALNWTGRIAQITVLAIMILLMRYSRVLFKNNAYKFANGDRLIELQGLVYNCNIWLISLIPLMLITDVWVRILWEFMIVNLCMCANTSEAIFVKQDNNRCTYARNGICLTRLDFVLIASLLLMLIYVNNPYAGTKNDMINMFFDNMIFEHLLF